MPAGDVDAALRDFFAFKTGLHAANDALLALAPFEVGPEATAEQVNTYLDAIDFFARAAARGATIKSRDTRR